MTHYIYAPQALIDGKVVSAKIGIDNHTIVSIEDWNPQDIPESSAGKTLTQGTSPAPLDKKSSSHQEASPAPQDIKSSSHQEASPAPLNTEATSPQEKSPAPHNAESSSSHNSESSNSFVRLGDDQILISGLVDTHVHVNEPGRTEWEGFASATAAAKAGGVTTLIDMPLNSIPSTTTPEALQIKKEAAQKSVINVGFWGGAVPENLGQLKKLWDCGVFGFKAFLIDSGVDEFPPLSPAQLKEAMKEIAQFDGLLIVHAEDEQLVTESGSSYESFLESRPPESEYKAIETVIAAAEETGCRTHILHLSSGHSLPLIKAAKERGVRITVETCPHYLTLFSEDVRSAASKCCPPIREASNRNLLWQGLEDGVIDMIVSDHSPCTAELKKFESFADAWGGIASVELGLPVVWSEARKRGIGLDRVVYWMSTAPAAWAGLSDRGAIEVGRRADLAVIRADDAFVVIPEKLHHKNPVTAYAQHALAGAVDETFVTAELIERP